MSFEVYKILCYPHALLHKKSTPIVNFSAQLKAYIQVLTQTCVQVGAGGIAAPQVGVCKRLFIADYRAVFEGPRQLERQADDFVLYDDAGKILEPVFPMVFINPEILESSQPITTDWEGCLSFPGAYSCVIPRFHSIHVRAQDADGEYFSIKTNHLYAAVNLQHEIDHLDGVLMIDRWQKSEYTEKQVLADIRRHQDDSAQRKKTKRDKPIDATKVSFDFL